MELAINCKHQHHTKYMLNIATYVHGDALLILYQNFQHHFASEPLLLSPSLQSCEFLCYDSYRFASSTFQSATLHTITKFKKSQIPKTHAALREL
jgi:hypothetical protein